MAPRTLEDAPILVLHKHLLICFNARMANRLRNLLCMTGRTLGKTGTLVWIFSVCDLVHAYSI